MSGRNVIDLSIVVLCYRSEENIIPFVSDLKENLSSITDSWEIVLVGNYLSGANDRTGEIVQSLASNDDRITAMVEPKLGMMGWDMRKGFQAANGRFICVIDGDGQFPIEAISRCYDNIIDSNLDMIKTFRMNRPDGMGVVSGQQDRQSSKAIRTYPEKIKQTYIRVFNPSTSYSIVKFPKKVPIELFFFIIGFIGVCISEYQYVRDNRHFSLRAYVVLWVFLLFIGIVAWIPLDWSRYYLPMFPAQVIMVTFGLTISFSWLYHAICRSNTTLENSSAG